MFLKGLKRAVNSPTGPEPSAEWRTHWGRTAEKEGVGEEGVVWIQNNSESVCPTGIRALTEQHGLSVMIS